MEEVKKEDGNIKTIVPIKGNLLEKVKNKLRKNGKQKCSQKGNIRK
jgi:hypothetical protein